MEYKKVWANLCSVGSRNTGNHVIQQCIAESYVVSTVSRCITFLEIHITSHFRLCFSRCVWILNVPLQGSNVQTSRNGHNVQIHCFLQTYLQTCNYIKEFLRFWAILNGIKSKKIIFSSAQWKTYVFCYEILTVLKLSYNKRARNPYVRRFFSKWHWLY